MIIAGLSGKGNGDAASVTLPPTTLTAGQNVGADATSDSAAASDANPGAVDVQLTVPGITQPDVVLGSADTAQKTVIANSLKVGSNGDEVRALQQRLTDLHFAPGPVDGAFGAGTQQAVWAFKKLVMKLRWQDLDASDNASEVTPEMWSQMQDPIVIQPRRPQIRGTHVEIYLPLQVMIVFDDASPTLITHVASGNDETWCETLSYDTDQYGQPLEEPRVSDECGVSHTPGGVFKFYRRYEGKRVGALGGMYNPVYFNYGIAVHGAKEVPRHPASHGCIRVNMDIAEYFPSLVKNGDYVFVWGQDGKEPEYYSKKERTPPFNKPNPNSTSTTSSTTSSTTTTAAPNSSATAATSAPAAPAATTATTSRPNATTPPVTTSAPNSTSAPVATTSPPAATSPPNTTAPPGP